MTAVCLLIYFAANRGTPCSMQVRTRGTFMALWPNSYDSFMSHWTLHTQWLPVSVKVQCTFKESYQKTEWLISALNWTTEDHWTSSTCCMFNISVSNMYHSSSITTSSHPHFHSSSFKSSFCVLYYISFIYSSVNFISFLNIFDLGKIILAIYTMDPHKLITSVRRLYW